MQKVILEMIRFITNTRSWMDDLEALFDQEVNSERYAPQKEFTLGDDLVTEFEAEFTGKRTDRIDRINETEKLREDKSLAEAKLRKIKNPKGVGSAARRAILTEANNKKRSKLRSQIARCQVRLDEIAIETGQTLDSETKEAKEEGRLLEKRNKRLGITAGGEAEESPPPPVQEHKLGGWGSSTPY